MELAVILIGLIVLGLCSGLFGALFGLGGGVIFVPILLLSGVAETATQAVAMSLVGIIAGSVGASTVLISKGLSNVRLGLMMEITTRIGAIIGAMLATYLESWILMVLFSVIIIYSAFRMIINPERTVEPSDGEDGPMTFRYRDESIGEDIRYEIQNVKSGMGICTFAGAISSMTGVGGGAIKVPLMNLHMHIPMKAASSTSSFMIGITAFSGAITYFFAGVFTDPAVSPPLSGAGIESLLPCSACLAFGAFSGSLIGARYARRIPSSHLRKYFSIVLFVMLSSSSSRQVVSCERTRSQQEHCDDPEGRNSHRHGPDARGTLPLLHGRDGHPDLHRPAGPDRLTFPGGHRILRGAGHREGLEMGGGRGHSLRRHCDRDRHQPRVIL